MPEMSWNVEGLMDKNFGIGFFFFDRLFGTFPLNNTLCNCLTRAKSNATALYRHARHAHRLARQQALKIV
jgi:sterol desaturase/sphingolipid hydroxylase (fatty acid hydroxylase superfamily)